MDRASIGRLLLVVPLLAAGLALGVPSPAAAAFACHTAPGLLSGITIKDSLVVEAGDFCRLQNVTVRGGVTVQPGGVFQATNTEIRGGLVGTDAQEAILQTTVVRGPATITGTNGFLSLSNTEIRGNLTLTGNHPNAIFRVIEATVRGTVTISHNVFAATFKGIFSNMIDGDLICEGNTDSGGNVLTTLIVADNTVGGVTTGQCIP